MPRIIDAHSHLSEHLQDELIPYAALNGLKYSLDELLRLMDESGITSGVLLSPPLRGGIPLPNERVLELCRRSEGMLSPVLTVEPSAESRSKVHPEGRAGDASDEHVQESLAE